MNNDSGRKVALVTGASSGIGMATAERLLADGLVVYAAARRVEKMADLAKMGALPVRMDVTSDEAIADAVSNIKQRHGGVDVLVNNAGFGCYGSVEDTSIEDAHYEFEVNLFGMAQVTRAVLPSMRTRGSGLIINISSMGGKIYTPLGAWYHATKHAVEGWSDCLRLEVAPFGIRVIIIEPGIIRTNFTDAMLAPMMERSGNSPYRHMANAVSASTMKIYSPDSSSPPSVVAATVSKAIRAKNPRTRYPVGKLARPLLFARKWLGDRVFDRLISASISQK